MTIESACLEKEVHRVSEKLLADELPQRRWLRLVTVVGSVSLCGLLIGCSGNSRPGHWAVQFAMMAQCNQLRLASGVQAAVSISSTITGLISSAARHSLGLHTDIRRLKPHSDASAIG